VVLLFIIRAVAVAVVELAIAVTVLVELAAVAIIRLLEQLILAAEVVVRHKMVLAVQPLEALLADQALL
jgi:hypothetical protein